MGGIKAYLVLRLLTILIGSYDRPKDFLLFGRGNRLVLSATWVFCGLISPQITSVGLFLKTHIVGVCGWLSQLSV